MPRCPRRGSVAKTERGPPPSLPLPPAPSLACLRMWYSQWFSGTGVSAATFHWFGPVDST